MASDRDRYEKWYAESLWALMPAMHRAADSEVFGEKGPLRELIDRIGAQMAVVRRSMDQLYDDQFVETADDWVVPYLGELVAANLVSPLDPRGQRLQVAKAIYYRRRAGTVGILEEAAYDVTGWEARVVEFFRNLGRTRHSLDLEIGRPADEHDPAAAAELQRVQRLVGRFTGTPSGGWADLRNVYGATRAHSAFDEYAHTMDARRPVDRTGWYNIPRLGVFVWRLHALPEGGDAERLLSTPVGNVAGCFTFDPTGREVPLFAGASRSSASYGSAWISPDEWELPGPIDAPLFELDRDTTPPHLYSFLGTGSVLEMNSLGVFRTATLNLVPLNAVFPDPARGRFFVTDGGPASTLRVFYHYGSAGRIGAGVYDRLLVARRAGRTLAAAPGADTAVTLGGTFLGTALGSAAASSTTTIVDSLTYTTVANLTAADVTIRALHATRPCIRTAPNTEWRITGAGNATLRLEGIFLSGADLVLDGDFENVELSFSTLDPGSAGDPSASNPFETAIDGRNLTPSRVFIEGKVRKLTISSCITGPIRTRNKGQLELLEIDRSIVQAIGTNRFDGTLPPLFDLEPFAERLQARLEPLSIALSNALTPATRAALDAAEAAEDYPPALAATLLGELNPQLANLNLGFGGAPPAAGPARARFNERVIVRFYRHAFGDEAIALSVGEVKITRSTILGPAVVHRIDVSESILHDVVTVDDAQHGCVRFSAWSSGSILPRKYTSVEIRPRAELFTSTEFAQPGYGQLRRDADRAAIVASETARSSIREGAENGSEMGAFYDEMNAVRERSLLLKLQELMPLGLIPAVVPVT
ncbi:MAG TPA: hypothetical protein VF266_16155 [Thermoanaerobaculia bacterium]